MKKHINQYYDLEHIAKEVRQGGHRKLVGGLWEQVGRLQFDFVRDRGLSPEMNVLDLGCGCLRVGVHLVNYLNPGRYFGVDISQELLNAGYEYELAELGLQQKLPRENLACNSEFSAHQFGVKFDIAIAQSVFTHLPLNHFKLCLSRLVDTIQPGGTFYATAFLSPPDHDWSEPLVHSRGGITTFPTSDPYHYQIADLAHCVKGLPWKMEVVSDWAHPRNQSMIMFTRSK